MTRTAASTILHELEFPDPAVCGSVELFISDCGDAALDLDRQRIVVPPFGKVVFETYFNCFSAEVWAQSAQLDDVHFEVDVDAPCIVELRSFASARSRSNGEEPEAGTIVSSTTVGPTDGRVSVPEQHAGRGIIAARVHALDQTVTIHGGRWLTETRPHREVRLGVAMTTFNRADYVSRNIGALAAYASRAAHHLDDVRVQIVDNASNLELDAVSGPLEVRVLPNRNLGGAGGFARNLMEYRAEGWATHVLFMDDDLSLLPSVIDRSRVFLRFASDDSACVSGAMLMEDEPTVQFEAGARYASRALHPLAAMRTNLPLTSTATLVKNAQDLGIEYGAWWFFAFPIDLTAENPLPVFVRGDDASFSVSHARGHIKTMNGIGVWHQPFEYKNNPMMFHLELRNLPLVSVLGDPGYGRVHFIKRFGALSFRSIIALKYDSAERMLAGTRDFLAGPDRWLSMDHVEELERIRAFDGERLVRQPPVEVPEHFSDARGLRRRIKALVAFGLLGGHLVPRRLSRLPRRAVPVQMRSIAAALGREELLYYWPPTSEGFVTRRDRRRFARLLGELAATVRQAWREFPGVAAEYRARRDEFVSDDYWMRQFEIDSLSLDSDAAPANREDAVS